MDEGGEGKVPQRAQQPEAGGEVESRLASVREAVGREATARQQAERERDLLMAAAESAADAIVVTDAQGIVRFVNAAYEQITGYERGEVLGRELRILDSEIEPDPEHGQVDGTPEPIAEALAQGRSWSGRLRRRRKSGEVYQVDCTIAPVLDGRGGVEGYVYVKRDVTERLRLESVAEAVATMNSLGAVFSGIRHEIGNPINSTKTALNLLLGNLERYEPAKVREYLTRALERMSHVEYLLKTLKSFNLYERPNLQPLAIRPFLVTFGNLAGRDLSEQGIALATSVAPDAPACTADPRALQQVLLNVIANAVDALADRPEPSISIRVERFGEAVRFRIADNGRGMDERALASLFKPFYTTKPNGTGLGLVTVRRMLAAMGGDVHISSRLDVGTTVDINLPGGEIAD